ncbi:hypothetical protein H8D57_04005, partial [bacterium]|nr:hypothetical protein [bacterium]
MGINNRLFMVFQKAHFKHSIPGIRFNPDQANHSPSEHVTLKAWHFIWSLIISIFFQVSCLSSNTWAQTEVEGEVSGEWDAEGSPYILVGNSTVPEDESLNISPGVEIVFGEDLILTVNGQIQAVGSEEDSIRFHGPEGIVSGQLIINESDVDTAYFAYCRFDSILYAISAFNHPLRIEDCRFVDNRYLRLEGGSALIRRNSFSSHLDVSSNFYILARDDVLESVELSDNTTYRTHIYVRNSGSVIAQRNRSINHSTLANGISYSCVGLTSCSRVVVTHNTEFKIWISGNSRDGLLVENNQLGSLGISENIGWNVVVRNNLISNLSVRMAYAEFTNNEFWDTDISGWIIPARIRFERNLFHEGVVVGDSCYVELTNNVIINDFSSNDSRAIRVGGAANRLQSSVTMNNNILISGRETPFAVGDDVDFVEGGYNCFWGFGGTYEGHDENLEGDIVEDPRFVRGYPFEYQLQANSPCIDSGNPDSPEDPDGTRADIGIYFYDQENGMPPAIISRHDAYTGWGMDFRYVVRATDWDGAIEFDFEGLPEWLEVGEDQLRRDFVSDSVVVSGRVPDDQEDFVFMVTSRDEDDLEDTLSVLVSVYPMTVLTGQIGGVLSRENSPYIIADTAYVAIDDSLVIEPGIHIYADTINFENRYTYSSYINVFGYFQAMGTEEDSIFFISLDSLESGRFLCINPNPDAHSEFNYCQFKRISPFIYEHNTTITHCSFDSTVHLDISGSYTVLEDNNFANTGVGIHQGNARIVNNIWTSTNGSGGISVGGSPDSVLIAQNRLEGCDYNISSYGARSTIIRNNIIKNGIGRHQSGISVRDVSDLEDGLTIVT